MCRRRSSRFTIRSTSHKAAITATVRLLLRGQYSLYSKADHKLISSHDDALHLYERVAFVGSELPDGRVADANDVWLADWYLQSLNAIDPKSAQRLGSTAG